MPSRSGDEAARETSPESVSGRRWKVPVVDLFSGVGGLSLGAARAGFEVRAAVEVEPNAFQAHQINFPSTIHLRRSVARLAGTDLRRLSQIGKSERFGLIGGPPCQGFSVIGRRDASDPRNRLFVHFFRIVAETRPIFFLAENVPGILADPNTKLRERALSLVNGYEVTGPITIGANEYGAPTSRERVFFIGVDRHRMASIDPSLLKQTSPETVLVRDALAGLPTRIDPATCADGWRKIHVKRCGPYAERLWGNVPAGVGDADAIERLLTRSEASGNLATVHTADVVRRFEELSFGEVDPISKSRRLDPNGLCPTLRAGTGPEKGRFQAVRPLHPTQPRVITPREAARLQGFPDWFQFSDTRWHSFRMIGNSVSPILAEGLLTIIHSVLRSS
jgi:DNA (cytosine-5)-methyltransferase 1